MRISAVFVIFGAFTTFSKETDGVAFARTYSNEARVKVIHGIVCSSRWIQTGLPHFSQNETDTKTSME